MSQKGKGHGEAVSFFRFALNLQRRLPAPGVLPSLFCIAFAVLCQSTLTFFVIFGSEIEETELFTLFNIL